MKAFDEWDKIAELTATRFCCTCAEEKGRYDGWKAALKWVKLQITHEDFCCIDCFELDLDEELEDE